MTDTGSPFSNKNDGTKFNVDPARLAAASGSTPPSGTPAADSAPRPPVGRPAGRRGGPAPRPTAAAASTPDPDNTATKAMPKVGSDDSDASTPSAPAAGKKNKNGKKSKKKDDNKPKKDKEGEKADDDSEPQDPTIRSFLKGKLKKKFGRDKKRKSHAKKTWKGRLGKWALILLLVFVGYKILEACNGPFLSGNSDGSTSMVAPNGVAPDGTPSKPDDILLTTEELADGKKIHAVFEKDKSISFDVHVDGNNVPVKISLSDGLRSINGNVRIGSSAQINESFAFCNRDRGGVCNISLHDSICDLWIGVKFQKDTDYRMFYINAIDLFNAKAPGTSQAYPGEENANGMCGIMKKS